VTPAEIRDRLARLRDAGAALRRRGARARIDALAHALDGWRDPRSPWRAALEAELPAATGFSPAMVREGLARGLAAWTGDALRALVAAELGGPAALAGDAPLAASGFGTSAAILAGAIPMPTLLALVAPLALGTPLLARASARDPVTPRLVARSLAETDAELGACVDVVSFPSASEPLVDALLEAECVSLTGSDETVSALRARVRGARRVLVHGHPLSLAALGPGATRGPALERAAAGLALDVALWDQLGCLSPIAVCAVDADPAAADRVADALARALERAEREWPRGRVDAAVAAEIAAARGEAELRAAAGRPLAVLASRGTRWTVVREDAPALRPGPLHRFVRVHPAEAPEDFLAALAPLARHLAAVAVAGFGPQAAALARALACAGASRVCAPGRLQAPPLAWHHDGEGVLAPHARFTDLDAEE
jgi:hypothetical protein